MIAIVAGTITPLAIAQGRGDDYLFALNVSRSRERRPAYVRPMPGDERTLERVLRVHEERSVEGRRVLDRRVSEGVRANRLIVHGGPRRRSTRDSRR